MTQFFFLFVCLSIPFLLCHRYILILLVETRYYYKIEDHHRLHTIMINPMIMNLRTRILSNREHSALVLIMSDATRHSVKCIDMLAIMIFRRNVPQNMYMEYKSEPKSTNGSNRWFKVNMWSVRVENAFRNINVYLKGSYTT